MTRRREEDGMGFAGFLPVKESHAEKMEQRAHDVKLWARSRIDYCRRGAPSGASEVEIRTLEAVLRMLNGDESNGGKGAT